MAEPYLICPDSWLKGTLEPNLTNGLIISAETGSTPSTVNKEYWDGGIPWLTPKEITKSDNINFISDTERTISELARVHCSVKIFPPGTVLLTKRAPIGAVAINSVPIATNQGFINFQCGNRLRPQYLAYWLLVNQPYLDLIANGSTYPEIYLGDLFELEISVPTIEEQDRILTVIHSLQFVSLIGSPMEHSIQHHDHMINSQSVTNRLKKITQSLLFSLISGQIELSKFSFKIS